MNSAQNNLRVKSRSVCCLPDQEADGRTGSIWKYFLWGGPGRVLGIPTNNSPESLNLVLVLVLVPVLKLELEV